MEGKIETSEEKPTKKQKLETENIEEKKEISIEKDLIRLGDRVMLHMYDDSIICTTIQPKEIFNCKFGSFPHIDMIGKAYGTKIFSKKNTGFIHILKFSPILWTKSLPHRTEILYAEDISMIISLLGLNVKSRVVEAGSGSGSLSTHISNRISQGHLYTFEFHKERCEQVKKDFLDNGLKNITATHRDVIKEGFKLEGDEKIDGTIDAVFLDLPRPQECANFVSQVLVKNGRFCSFSPCIEQVQETCEKFALSGFTDLKVIECLGKNYFLKKFSGKDCVVPYDEMRGHTGYLTFARKN